MADAVTISALLVARDQASATINRVGQATQKLGLSLVKLGAPLVAVGALSLRTFAGFEKSMVRVGAVSRATSDELEELTDIAREMGRETIFSAREAADALVFLAQAGQSASEAVESLPAVLQLAAAGSIELSRAADIVTNVMASMNLEVSDLANANDVLVTAFTSANTNLQQLGQAFKFVGPVAAAAGLSLEEVAASLALMGNAGIQATMAGTALRGAVVRLLAPTRAVRDVIEEMGLELNNTDGSIKSLVEIIEELERVSIDNAENAGRAMTLFGLRAGPGMLALVGQGSEALRELQTEMENAGGRAKEVADAEMDTFAGSMARLRAAVEGLAIEIGAVLAPAVRDLIDDLLPIISAVADWAKEHPKLTAALIGGSAIMVSLGAVLTAIGLILPGIVTGFGLLATAITAVGVSSLVAVSRITIFVSAMFAATTAIRTFNAIAEGSASQLTSEGRKAFREYERGAASLSDVFKAELKGTMLEAFDAVNVFNDGIGDSTKVMKTAEEEAKKLSDSIDKILNAAKGGGGGGPGGLGEIIPGSIFERLGAADDPGAPFSLAGLTGFNRTVQKVTGDLKQFTDEMIANAFAGNDLRMMYDTATGELIEFTTNSLIAAQAQERLKNGIVGVTNALSAFDSDLGPPGAAEGFGRGRGAGGFGLLPGQQVVSGDLIAELAAQLRSGEIESARLTDEGQFGVGLTINAEVNFDGDRVGSAIGHSVQDGG